MRLFIRHSDYLRRFAFLVALTLGLASPALRSAAITIDFETFPDGSVIDDLTPLSNQFPFLTFSNATVLTAQISLNEVEFPPKSGSNAVFDDGGSIWMEFATPISFFSAYFTYALPLRIEAFSAGGDSLAVTNSGFNDNRGVFGESGSSPNEFLSVQSVAHIARVVVTADPGGNSFAMDDLSVTPIPEPRLTAIFAGLAVVLLYTRKRRAASLMAVSCLGIGYAFAQPPGLPEVSPKFVLENTATEINVISRIANPDVDPLSVLIQSVDGKTITPLGPMTNGGSGLIYTGKINLTVPPGKEVRLRVSMGIKGKPLRSNCGEATVTAMDAFITNFAPAAVEQMLKDKNITAPADFLKRLPPADFKRDWIFMSLSDSLQTGSATKPRVILQTAADSKQVFGVALDNAELEYMLFDETTKKNQFRFFLIHDKLVDENAANAIGDSKRCSNCHFGLRALTWPYPRPNWDAYDSWGGMLPFNRDRIYENSTEESAIKALLKNLRNDPIITQLDLPPGITRECNGDVVITYPGGQFIDSGAAGRMTGVKYADAVPPVYPGDANVNVTQGKNYLTVKSNSVRLAVDEGRGVALFDHLTKLNGLRVAQEIADSFAARGNALDLRPAAFAIANGCAIDGTNLNTFAPDDALKQFFGVSDAGAFPGAFTALVDSTKSRRQDLPQMKANQQADNILELMKVYGGVQSGAGITQEVGRRSLFGPPSQGADFEKDARTGFMVDRELYGAQDSKLALFRLFLQTGGIPVRRWTMSIKGEKEDHSVTYTFGDLFDLFYIPAIRSIVGDQDAVKVDGTAFGKKFKDLTCAELADLSKGWIDKAFKANPGMFGAP